LIYRDFLRWQNFAFYACGWVQVVYLALVALIVMIDSVATLTFRWKEYGELTHGQTDATSVIFFLCPSRCVARSRTMLQSIRIVNVLFRLFWRILRS
jgi:hypothetical protein